MTSSDELPDAPARRRVGRIYDAPLRWWRDNREQRRRAHSHLAVAPGLPDKDLVRVRAVITELLGRHHAATQRAEIATIADAYLSLNDEGRTAFLHMLAHDFWTDPAQVDAAIARVRDGADRRASEHELRRALVPAATHL